MRHRIVMLVIAASVALAVESASPAPAQTPPMPPGHPPTPSQTPTLPPGHPPTGGGGGTPSIPAPPPSSGVGAQSLTWSAPAGWVSEAPASAMRRAQYKINGPGGAAECVVFYFGPGQGGDAKANADRWIGQFQKPGGGVPASKTRTIKVGDIPVMMVEVSGTYVGGMGGGPAGPPKQDYELLGAIAEGPDAMWFFRATGPRTTLEPQKAAFEGMIRSIKRGR